MAGSAAPSTWRSQLTLPGVAPEAMQSVTGARPERTTPPHWPEEFAPLMPMTLSRLVKMIGRVAVPFAWIVLPRLTFRKLEPEA